MPSTEEIQAQIQDLAVPLQAEYSRSSAKLSLAFCCFYEVPGTECTTCWWVNFLAVWLSWLGLPQRLWNSSLIQQETTHMDNTGSRRGLVRICLHKQRLGLQPAVQQSASL